MDIALDESKINESRTQLITLTKNLLHTLENNDRTKIVLAQQAFTSTIAILWNAIEEMDIDPRPKAIPRLIVGWAIQELPKEIQDPANDRRIKRELILFQRSLMMLRLADIDS
jgi:hypothetical protein